MEELSCSPGDRTYNNINVFYVTVCMSEHVKAYLPLHYLILFVNNTSKEFIIRN